MNALGTKIWLHDLSPFLVQFSNSLGVSWYGLSYAAGLALGGIFMLRLGKRELSTEQATTFVGWAACGVLFGGRLGYAVFYDPRLLSEWNSVAPYWSLLKVWEGGMSSHGGIVGLLLSTVLFARREKLDCRRLLDLATLGGTCGIFFGRIANFINGELYGRIASEGFPFAVKFPKEIFLWAHQALEPATASRLELERLTPAVQALGGVDQTTWEKWLTLIPKLSKEPAYMRAGLKAEIFSVLEELVRAVQQGNEGVRSALAVVLTARYPSQIFAAGLEGLLVFGLLLIAWRKVRKPGVIASLWLISYSIARIFSEVFRSPDPHLGFQLLGLTRGQWLSLLSLFFGIATLIYFERMTFATSHRPLPPKTTDISI